MTVKAQIIKDIEGINDENLLKEIYILMKDIQGLKKYIVLNDEQKINIEEAQTEYGKGKFYETDELFKDLLNE